MLKSSSVLLGFVIAAVASAGLLLGFGLLANAPETSTPLEPAASNTELPKSTGVKAVVAGNDQPTSDSEVSRNILADAQMPAAKETDAVESPSIPAQGVAPIKTTAAESQLNLLEVSDLTAEVAAQLVSSQSLKPDFKPSRDELQLDATLVSAGATPSMVRQMRLALIDSHPHGSRRFEQILARTDSPEWQAVANSFGDYVHLPKVTALSPEAAQALAGFSGSITLLGLEQISVPAARALASGKATPLLYGLKSLDADVAKELAAANGIGLRGVKSLSPEAANALAHGKLESINLSGLDELPPAVAESLASFGGSLDLSGVKRLSVESAQHLGRSSFPYLTLSGLQDLGVDAAQQLAGHKGVLVLGGLSNMSPEVAKALSTHDGYLVLSDVTVRVPGLVVAPRALDSVVAGSVLRLPVYKALVADGETALRVTDDRAPPPQQSQRAPRPPKEPAKTAKSVTDIMDSPDEYVNGTYKVNVWVDTFWMHREKQTLPNDEVFFDGYCLKIKDGLRDARSAEGLGSIALSLSEVSPVISSKELARGLQDALQRRREYRFLATVTLSRRDVLTSNILAPNAPPKEGFYLLMDITRLEATRPDGSAVVVDGQSTAEDFAALKSVFEPSAVVATNPATALQSKKPDDRRESLARFEDQCKKLCLGMVAACLEANGKPTLAVGSFADTKFVGFAGRLDAQSKGTGISAGCAKGTVAYFSMYGPLIMEATARMANQEVPQGGLVAMMNGWIKEGSGHLAESGDADKYWTQVAATYCLSQLYGDGNGFNAALDAQLLRDGQQPLVNHLVGSIQRLRRTMCDQLAKQYADSVEAGLKKFGPPSIAEKSPEAAADK